MSDKMTEDLITDLMNTLIEGVIIDLNRRINDGEVSIEQELQILQLFLAIAAAAQGK